MNSELPTTAARLSNSAASFSLFQKLCIIIFVMITLIMFGRGYISYIQTLISYEKSALQRADFLQQTFKTLTERSSRELFRSADRYALPSSDELANQKIPAPSLLSGIDSVVFITPGGEILSSAFVEGASFVPGAADIRRAVSAISASQRPQAALSCDEDCVQSVFIPVINDNGDELIININRSATLLFQDFYDLTRAELLIMSPAENQRRDYRVLLSSHGQESEEILSAITDSAVVDPLSNEQFFGRTHLGFYAAKFFSLENSRLRVAIISDESQMKVIARKAIREVIIAAILTMALVIAVVYITLRPPLSTLVRITEILPLLSSAQFRQASLALQNIKRRATFPDEIDILHDTTEKVNQALEQLSDDVRRHRDDLQDKVHALTEAKQFNEMLLDNSPMVIVTHHENGSIHNINAMGRRLSGLEKSLPLNANINHWVRDPDRNTSLSASLHNMTRKGQKKLQNEMPFLACDGQIHDFLWTHSVISIDGKTLFLSLGVDITETRRAEESLRWLGEHDRVTGLLNRSTFIEEADRHIHSLDANQYINLIMVDLDNFSEFNDRFGFDCGDSLLRKFATNISDSLGDARLLARTGSGEFCVLMITRDDQQLEREKLEKLTSFQVSTGASSETISATLIVDHYSNDVNSIDDLLSNVTSVMQRMKNKAKGHVYFVDDEDSKESRQEKYQLKEQLIQALNSNRLVLFYQPIVDMSRQYVSHCECLVRMLDDEGSFIAPAKFLGIATESGLMPRIDYIVIEKAMRQLAAWQQAGVKTQLSINVTAPTLEQPDFSGRLQEIIRGTGADPQSLIFELVETDALENIDNARKLLEQIKVSGAKIALDDFGIGFTSFEYVRELPVDYIKIDQAFIRFIHERENDQVLVRSIVEMSHSLGKKVIAEGVEELAAVDILRDMQVDYIQGYYISRPVPISALDLSIRL